MQAVGADHVQRVFGVLELGEVDITLDVTPVRRRKYDDVQCTTAHAIDDPTAPERAVTQIGVAW